ncbi:hypothetical protein D3C76_1692880 [compost metagenome]
MNQVKMAPNIEMAIIRVNEVSGKNTLSTVARAMPMLDSIRALTGIPRLLSAPMAAGAWPARDRLNIMRVVI